MIPQALDVPSIVLLDMARALLLGDRPKGVRCQAAQGCCTGNRGAMAGRMDGEVAFVSGENISNAALK